MRKCERVRTFALLCEMEAVVLDVDAARRDRRDAEKADRQCPRDAGMRDATIGPAVAEYVDDGAGGRSVMREPEQQTDAGREFDVRAGSRQR